MKCLVFLISRIRQYYQSSKAIFCIFAVGSIVLDLLIIFMYGSTVSYMRTKHVNTSYYCTYRVITDEGDYDALSDELEKVLRENDIKDIVYSSLWRDDRSVTLFQASKNDDAGLECDKLKGRISFTESEIQNRESCVIASYFQGGGNSSVKPGDTVSCGPGEFNVIGVGTFNSGYYIPSTLFEALDLPVGSIDVILNERLAMEEHQPFMDKLSAIPGVINVIPAYGVAEDIEQVPSDIAAVAVLYIFSVAALLFLMQYMTSLNRKTDTVSELVGARRGSIAFYLFSERFLIALASSVLATAIHKIFYGSVFERFYLTAVDYEWRDYFIITAVIILTSVLASVPFVISYVRRSALGTLRK